MSTLVADTRNVFQREMSLVLRIRFRSFSLWYSRWFSWVSLARCSPARLIRP